MADNVWRLATWRRQKRPPIEHRATSPHNCTGPHALGAMYSGASEASGGANHTVWRRPSPDQLTTATPLRGSGRRHPSFTRLRRLAVTTETPQVGRFRYGCVAPEPPPYPLLVRRGLGEPRPSLESTSARELSSGRMRGLLGGARILRSNPGCIALRAMPGVPNSRLRAPARPSRACPL